MRARHLRDKDNAAAVRQETAGRMRLKAVLTGLPSLYLDAPILAEYGMPREMLKRDLST